MSITLPEPSPIRSFEFFGGYASGAAVFPPPAEWTGDSVDGLLSVVLLSLYTDRRVESYELPTDENDRRGWWGDTYPRTAGDVWGSRLWLLDRAKLASGEARRLDAVTVATPEIAEDYIREALAWLLTDGVCTSIEVTTTRTRTTSGRPDGIAVEIVLVRDRTDDPVVLRFDDLWSGLGYV
jgi:phage gp46-like protein